MKIQYLGTAAAEGWPGIFCNCAMCREAARRGGKDLRSRSQAVIDGALLVDFPPDSYMHMLQFGLPLPEINDILLTHAHQDHFYPLDLTMRGCGFSDEVTTVLTVFGDETGKKLFDDTCAEKDSRWELDKRLKYNVIPAVVPLQTSGYTVTPLLANHDKSERCLNFIIEKDGKSLLYANDTGLFPDATWDYLKGRAFDLVSMDCTMGQLKEGTNHMGLPDNALMQRRLRGMGCAREDSVWVITHFSHHGGLLHEELERAAAPYGFLAAYDGMTVEF